MLANRISEYMKCNGIKQAWLARELDVPVTTFNGIMNGRSALKADMFVQICNILKVPPETFLEKGG